nr:XRE family transcriptional regulator [Marinactinospora thermotolerans]
MGGMEHSAATDRLLAEIGPRLRRVRVRRDVTLASLSQATGISTSTLSRLESGRRRPSLELLLPIARAHQIPLDELVGAAETEDPRVRVSPRSVNGMTVLPLSRRPDRQHAYRMVIPSSRFVPEPSAHEGHEWLYVLSGRLRLLLAEQDVVMNPGEAAEFDTRLPHWFGSTGEGAVEILSLFGSHGERVHLRGRARGDRERPA